MIKEEVNKHPVFEGRGGTFVKKSCSFTQSIDYKRTGKKIVPKYPVVSIGWLAWIHATCMNSGYMLQPCLTGTFACILPGDFPEVP